MFPQAWQVGLDIQIDCVRAVAAQRRRNGWQLHHWWQQALPQAVCAMAACNLPNS